MHRRGWRRRGTVESLAGRVQVQLSTVLNGRRVLVVEDQMLVALDLEQMLRGLGAAHVDLAASVEQSLAIVAAAPPDCAIVDLKLQEETPLPLVQLLTERRIPFAFASGYSDLRAVPAAYRNTLLLRKPIALSDLSAAVSGFAMKAQDPR